MAWSERERRVRDVESGTHWTIASGLWSGMMSVVNWGRRRDMPRRRGVLSFRDTVKDRTKGRETGSGSDPLLQYCMDKIVIDKAVTFRYGVAGANSMYDEQRLSFLSFLNCPATWFSSASRMFRVRRSAT